MRDDPWVAGDSYEPYVGRWSRQVAPLFVSWLGLPAGLRWADVGCGTGALTSAIVAGAAPASVTAVDPAAGFVQWASRHLSDPRVSFAVGDATRLEPGSADVVASGLVLNFIPEPREALAAMKAAATGGTVAAYVWDYSGGMQMIHQFWEVAVALDPAAAPLHEAARFSGWSPELLERRWRGAGLDGLDVAELAAEITFADFDELWAPFLGGTGPSPAYVAGLDGDARAELREAYRSALPVAGDGSLTLKARAYAVRGQA
jgi:SAM-dependent methyltransferase